MSEYERPRPQPTPETQNYWDGAKAGELRLQRCGGCDHVYFPARPFCPACSSRDVNWFTASGKGTLFSYVINHRAPKGFEAPYIIAVVQLEEGPRMMSNLVDCPQTPDELEIDMPLEVTFVKATADISIPQFRPVGA